MCVRLICTIMVVLFAVHQATAKAALSMDQIEKTAQTLRNTCTTKSNVDPALVAGIQKGEYPDDRTLKCYAHCVMKAMRTFKGGRVDIDMMVKQVDMLMPADMAGPLKETSIACASAAPAGDDCETSFQFVKCSYDRDPSHFFFP